MRTRLNTRSRKGRPRRTGVLNSLLDGGGGGGSALQFVVSHWDVSTYVSGPTIVDDVGSADLTPTLFTLDTINTVQAMKRSSTNTLARMRTTVHPLAGSLSQPFTIIMVYQSNGTSDDCLVDTGTASPNRALVHSAGQANWWIDAGTTTNTGRPDSSTAAVYTAVFNGASSYFWVNETKYGPFSCGTAGANGNEMAFGNVVAGGLGIATQSRFGEAYVSNGIESDAAIEAKVLELKTKWNIA